ncbi:MAG: hypothetical protein ACI8PZ_003616 [Myxococcota bacterium]|jgi:hypothetical protein
MLPLALSLAAFAQPAIVHATATNMHAKPSADAAEVGRLARHTPVQVTASHGDWSEVAVDGLPVAHPLSGWVRTDTLGAHPLDAPAPPNSPDAVWLASCGDSGRSMLRARLDADGWHPVGGYAGEMAEALAKARTAGVQQWWYAGDEHHLPTHRVGRPTPFPAPFATPITNETEPSPWVPGTSPLDDGSRAVVLGQRDQLGWLATAPLNLAHPERVSTDSVWSLAASMAALQDDPVVGGSVIHPIPGLREVRLRVPYTWRSCGGDGPTGFAEVFALVDEHDQPVAGLHAVDGQRFMRRVDRAQWLTFPGRPEPLHIGIYSSTDGTGTQEVLIGVAGDVVHEAATVVEQWGC